MSRPEFPHPDQFQPLDGPDYARVVDHVMTACKLGGVVRADLVAARLVATVEATRRIVDELVELSGISDLALIDLGKDW